MSDIIINREASDKSLELIDVDYESCPLIAKGDYLCHTFDLEVIFERFDHYIKRGTLSDPPRLLRYKKVDDYAVKEKNGRVIGTEVFVNELGFVVALQKISNQCNSDINRIYDEDFIELYQNMTHIISDLFGKKPFEESSCKLSVYSQYNGESSANQPEISSEKIAINEDRISSVILIEALFIYQLCRTVKRKSELLLYNKSLVSELICIEYIEALFPFSEPGGYLVNEREKKQMKSFYEMWKMGDDINSLRARFSESITNISLYRSHIERNRQAMLDFTILGLTFLTLTQVSAPISEIAIKFGVLLSIQTINQICVFCSIACLIIGSWSFIVKPKIAFIIEKVKRIWYSRKAKSVCVKLTDNEQNF